MFRSWASITVRVAARWRNVAVIGTIGIPHVGSGEGAEVDASDDAIGYCVIGLVSE